MDPWEAVKWIAIFRLILPDALFRLCGGRVENLGELQPLAVKAGINGVMMGNFLTTLGNAPEEDRAMFEHWGSTSPRQPDNGANPRPDNRSGWLDGETPDVVAEHLEAAAPALNVTLWDPSTQLRYAKKSSVPPRPDGAPNRGLRPAAEGQSHMLDLRIDWTSSRSSASTAACAWSAARRARASCSTASPCCCCAPTTTSASPTTRGSARRRPTPRCAGASAAAPRASSPGTMTMHRRLEERLAAFKGTQSALLFGSGYLANMGVVPALAGKSEVVFSDELNHASIIDGCRLAARRDVRLPPRRHRSTSPGACARPRAAAR